MSVRRQIAEKDGNVALTRYVRDASGNIMAVYADDEVPDVQWAGVTGVTVSGTTLTKGATTSAWDAGLASVQKIPAGGNGWVQTTVGDSPAIDINTGRFFGLSATDADASYIGIQYGLYLVAGGALDVFESGLVRGRFGSYAAGDVLRVERVNTTVYYKRNGVVFYTSTVPSTTELLADFSFFHSGGRLLNVQFNVGEAPTEQPIYGSSRLGQYLGWRKAGQQRLGRKQFELTNHLGNVLAVVTDNINLNATTAWATVVSATDYYPFGLEMAGRSYQNEKYRYGFNGKEKDQKVEFGKTSYDYGFRIYNPTIAKFLSVDPLTDSYPMLTPFQFASNRPIDGIDLDGLEFYEAGKMDLKLLGYKHTNNYVITDILIRQNAQFNVPNKRPDDGHNAMDDGFVVPERYVTLVQTQHPNSRTQFNGNYTIKTKEVPQVTSNQPALGWAAFVVELINITKQFMEIPTEKEEVFRKQVFALAQSEKLVRNALEKGMLPEQISSNSTAVTDLVNYMTDYKTLPFGGANGVTLEYIQMIKALGRHLFENQKAVENGTYNLFEYIDFEKINHMYLDRPSSEKYVERRRDKVKDAVHRTIENYKKVGIKAGQTEVSKGN